MLGSAGLMIEELRIFEIFEVIITRIIKKL